jgi:hypothetical protein
MVEEGRDQLACTSCAWKGQKAEKEPEPELASVGN